MLTACKQTTKQGEYNSNHIKMANTEKGVVIIALDKSNQAEYAANCEYSRTCYRACQNNTSTTFQHVSSNTSLLYPARSQLIYQKLIFYTIQSIHKESNFYFDVYMAERSFTSGIKRHVKINILDYLEYLHRPTNSLVFVHVVELPQDAFEASK